MLGTTVFPKTQEQQLAVRESFAFTRTLATDNQGGEVVTLWISWSVAESLDDDERKYPDYIPLENCAVEFFESFAARCGEKTWECMVLALGRRLMAFESRLNELTITIEIPKKRGRLDRRASVHLERLHAS